jgi:PKD repeat protein
MHMPWRTLVAALTATVGMGYVPVAAEAASHQVPASARVQATQAHPGPSGGAVSWLPRAIALRVRDPGAYARAKRAAQLPAPQRVSPAFRGGGPHTAVFGGLNASGLSAAQQIAQFGVAGDVTPPDTTGAIGPTQYIEIVNSEIAIYNRTSLSLEGSPVGLGTFTGGTFPCDVQIKFDPQSGRWFYLALRCDGTTASNELYVGFSKAATPRDLTPASWCTYTVPSNPVTSIDDYPKLGLDAGHIIIGSNSFDALTAAFLTAHIMAAPKPPAGPISSCGGPPTFTVFGSAAQPLRTGAGNAAYTPEPATVADGSASTGYIVAADFDDPNDVGGSNLMVWHVTDSGGVPNLIADGDIPIPSFSVPPPVPQPGSSDKIDSLDGRLTQAVAAADPQAGGAEAVWTQHTISDGAGGSVVRWYEVIPSKLSVRQLGTVSDTAGFAFNGAIAPTLHGGAVINYNVGGPNQTIQIKAQSRVPSAPSGEMFKPVTLAASADVDSDLSCPSQGFMEFGTTSCRWGDYAGMSTDPVNPDVAWGSNQVNGPTPSGGGVAQWATRTFALTPTLAPAAAAFASTPNPAAPRAAVGFNGSASTTDPDATITSYSWRFGDGSTGTGVTTSHTYRTPGTYTATLTIADNFGQTATTTHTIAVIGQPRAAFTALPNPVAAGSKVGFNAGPSADPGATITSYSWRFGDGSTGTGVTTSHTYRASGTYTATLTIADNFGRTATTAHSIAVRPPPRGRISIRSPQQLLVVLQRGLVVRLSVGQRSKVRFALTTPIRLANQPKPTTLTLVRTRVRTIPAGAQAITLKFNPAKARLLAGAKTVVVTVQTFLTDTDGVKVTLSAKVRLKR